MQSADLNFKSFKTFLISAKGTYYFTSKLLASSPFELYKNFLPFELAAEMLSSLVRATNVIQVLTSSMDLYYVY